MKYGLIGESLVHSYSKEIHEALGRYAYSLFSLMPEEMPDFIKARDFGGLNVTIPYKQEVMALCDEVSDLAASIGAVNTLYWKTAARTLVGHNTDYEGFLYAAKGAEIDFSGRNVLILGTGGTSLMTRKAAADEGAAKVYAATRSKTALSGTGISRTGISGTTQPAHDATAVTLSGAGISGATQPAHGAAAVTLSGAGISRTGISGTTQPAHDAAAVTLSYDALPEIASSIDIIVNTTPVGTFPNNLQSIISLADFPNCSAVIDVIYNPFKTRLLLDAEKAGLKHANGLPMLVAQATAAAGYFLGTPGAFTGENERIIDMLARKMRNMVLIGMPGCGKTTIGKLLAERSGKRFVDMDEEIVRRTGKPIPQIFDEMGEKGFRDLETETALELGKQRGLILATGGGAILRQENVDALKQNGLILHVKRPVGSLPTDGRPLSRDRNALREMEKARMPLYEAAADRTFDNGMHRRPEELADAVSDLIDLI